MAENSLVTIIISIRRHVIRDASKKRIRQYGGPNPLNAGAAGLETNCNGGSYRNGVSYDILKKLQVVDTYQKLLEARNGFGEPSLRVVA